MNADSENREEGPSLAFLSLFSFVSLGVLGAIVPFLGAQLAERGLRPEEIGWLMAMIPLGRIIGAPLWGQLADRYRAAGLLDGGQNGGLDGALQDEDDEPGT
jgi:MFS family permease